MNSNSCAAPARERQIGMEDLLAYQETVFLICLGFTRHHWDAQELTQETYLQAQQRLHQLREPDAAKAWLCRLARNLCLDHLRSCKWRRFMGLETTRERSHDENPEALLVNHELLQQVKNAIERLPEKLREVFVLNAYGELTYAEIAKAVDIPIGTVMSRLSRARAIIKNAVGKGGRHG